jgi:hypothetical protein
MKTNRFYIVVAAIMLLMTSCRDNDSRMLTIINEDGTCSREFSFHPYSTSVMVPSDEPIENDGLHFGAGWQRSWSVVGDSVRHPVPLTQEQWDSLQRVFPKQSVRNKILMHTKRNFQNVSEMSDSLTSIVGHLFKATASLDKHFKWFYTDYVYQETLAITDIEQIFSIPLDRFVSADTASYWFTGQPNLAAGLTGAEQKELLDNIEPKISQWFNACTMSFVYAQVCLRYDEVKNPPVSKEQYLALKDSIVMSPAVRNMDLFSDISQVSKIIKDFYHSDAYTPLFSDSKEWERVLDKKYKSYEYLVMMAPTLDYVMPGKVMDDGDGVVENNVIHYKFSGERLIPHDYVITATSRVINVWAFIVTILVILLAIGSFVYKHKG